MPPNSEVEMRKSSSRRSSGRVSAKRDSLRKSKSKGTRTSSDNTLSSGRRSSRRTSSKHTSSRRRRNKQSDGFNVLRSAWMLVMPFIVTAWTWTAVMWSLVLTWILIKIRRAYWKATDQEVDMVTSSKEFGACLHGCVSFLVFDMNPFWSRTIIRDVPMEEIPGKSIFMGNHLSYSDGWFGSGMNKMAPKIAVQGPVFDMPFLGDIIRETGNIPVDFEERADGSWGTAPGAGQRILARAQEYLEADCPVAVMPEGAISLTGELLPFKLGFFKLAVETDTPIVPFAMWGVQEAWPMDLTKNGWSVPEKFMRSASAWGHVGAPIYPEGRTPEELSEAVRARIIEMRNALPNYSGNDEHYNQDVKKY